MVSKACGIDRGAEQIAASHFFSTKTRVQAAAHVAKVNMVISTRGA